MRHQIGRTHKEQGDDLRMDDDFFDGVSEAAKERTLNAMNDRAGHLWPWLTLVNPLQYLPASLKDTPDEELAERYKQRYQAIVKSAKSGTDYPFLASEYQLDYAELAGQLGLFPNPPQISTVSNQRLIQSTSRELAGELDFLTAIVQTGSVISGVSRLMGMVGAARSTYDAQDIPTLRELLEAKFRGQTPNLAAIKDSKLWNNKDDLTSMLIDRGLRSVVINHHGIVQGVPVDTERNYAFEQSALRMKTEIRRLMRVH